MLQYLAYFLVLSNFFTEDSPSFIVQVCVCAYSMRQKQQ